MQYLRARYYNPASGTFNRLDPFYGRVGDPQSLHKYLYVHGDPVQGIDPSGLYLAAVSTSMLGSIASAFGRLSSAVGRTRLVNAQATAVVNAYTLMMLNHSLAQARRRPSGWVINIGVGAGLLGVAAGGGLCIYGLRGKYYVQLFHEWGLAPFYAAKGRQQSHQFGVGGLVTAGVTFGLDGPHDFAGGGLCATFPFAGFHYMKFLLSYKTQAMAQFFNLLSRATLGARMNRQPGVIQILASDDWRSSAILVGTRSFSWSATRYKGTEAVEFGSLPALMQEIGNRFGSLVSPAWLNDLGAGIVKLEQGLDDLPPLL
jgi:hypothetical protein